MIQQIQLMLSSGNPRLITAQIQGSAQQDGIYVFFNYSLAFFISLATAGETSLLNMKDWFKTSIIHFIHFVLIRSIPLRLRISVTAEHFSLFMLAAFFKGCDFLCRENFFIFEQKFLRTRLN